MFFLVKWYPFHNPETSYISILFDTLLTLTTIGGGFAIGIGVLHFLLFPNSVIYVTSLLPVEYQSKFYIFLPFSMFYFKAYGCAIWNGIMHFYCVSTYSFYITPFVSQDLRIGRKGTYRTRDDLRSPKTLSRVYRALQVIHVISTQTYGIILVPAQGIIGQIILLCVYTLATHGGNFLASGNYTVLLMLLGIAVILFVFWSLVLQFGGFFFMASRRTLKSWKKLNFIWERNELKDLSKFRKSCKPLRIEYPGYYKIGNLSMLKFWQGILKGIFRALKLF